MQPNDQSRPKPPERKKANTTDLGRSDFQNPRLSKNEKRQLNSAAFEPPPASQEESIFRHSNWSRKRALVMAALAGTGTPATAMERFRQCGAQAVVFQHEETGKLRIAAEYCKNRHCEPCARQKANLLAANLRKKLEGARERQYRFITLTLKHTDTPLADQIKRIYECFAKLRKGKLWTASQKGGCTILEIKWDEKKRHWHPHLHIIADGKFLSQNDLSGAWLHITGDSYIVDIKALKTGNDAAHYVAKYVSKGTNDEVWKDTDAAQEWVTATKGVRSCATWGTWRGFKLLEPPPRDEAWKPLITLQSLISQALAGSLVHQNLFQLVCDGCKYDPNKKRKAKCDIPPIV